MSDAKIQELRRRVASFDPEAERELAYLLRRDGHVSAALDLLVEARVLKAWHESPSICAGRAAKAGRSQWVMQKNISLTPGYGTACLSYGSHEQVLQTFVVPGPGWFRDVSNDSSLEFTVQNMRDHSQTMHVSWMRTPSRG